MNTGQRVVTVLAALTAAATLSLITVGTASAVNTGGDIDAAGGTGISNNGLIIS